jgi:hypothetical protein
VEVVAVTVKASRRSAAVRMGLGDLFWQTQVVRMQARHSGTRVRESAVVLELRTVEETILLPVDGAVAVVEAR